MSFVTHALIGNLAGGQIIVIDKNGNVRVVNEGEQLLPGEVVISGDASLVESAQNPEVSVNLVQDSGDLTDITGEIDAIFAALEEGVDPTQLGDEFATAAGGTSGSSLTPTGTIERDGVEALASTNFDTSGLESIGLSTTQSLALLNPQFSPIFVDINNDPLGESTTVVTDEDTPISGTLTATDQNTQDTLTYSQSTAPTNGNAVVNSDGTWTYTPNENYNGPDSFTVIVDDGNGGTDTLVVNIDVTPVNDAPVAEPETRSLLEDQVITGTLTATDVDLPEGESLVFTTISEVAGLTLNPDGSYTFDTSSYDRLAEGEVETIEVPITVTDDQGATDTTTLTIAITGTNDAATVSSASVTLQETDAPLTTGGKLTSQDIDNPDNKFTPNTIEGSKGTFSIDEDGNWSFTANSAFNELNVGDTEQASFTVTSVDGTPSTVTVTIEGTNDAATVSSASVTLQETDAPLTTGGKLTSQDIDNPDNKFTPNTIEGSKGTFSIDEDGNWSFTANSAFNELNVGDTEQASFTVTSVDGTPSTVTVTIEGTNDAATVSSASVTLQETDAPLTTGGKLTSQDIDNPDNKFTPNTIEGSKGTFSIDEDGNWSFTANSAFNELNVGDTEQASFTVTSVDGTPSTVTVTIEGTNDAATVSSASVTLQETDAPLTTGGKLTSQDIDNPDNKFTPNTIEGSKGTFSIDEDGNWSFTANSAFNELNVGDTEQASFTVTSVDGTPSTVTVTIEGTNDAATVSSASVTLQETDAPLTTGGKLTSQDIDNPDNKFTPNTIEGSKGTFSIDEDGNWSFTANSAFNELNVGDTEQASFTVTSVDGTPSTVTVTIEGTNDAATVSSASVTLQETDAPLTTGGKLTSQDIDNPDNKFTPNTIEGSKGTFSIDEDGNWSFTANSAFNELNVGDTEQASFTVTSVDGTPSTVTVTIEGTNDAATVSSASVTLQETDAPLTTGGKLTSQDIDNPDNKFTPNTIEGSKGTFSIDEDGNWSFTANSAFNELNVGDTEQASFTVTSVDGTPSTVTVTIEGTNDAATVSSASVTLQETDAPLTTGGKLTSQDIDNPDNKFTPNTIEGSKGTFSIDEDGNWSFTANSAFNELNVGDTEQASFTVTSVDGTPSTVTVTIEGTNDAATVSSASVTLQETDAPLTTGGKLTSQDIDNPDNKFTPNTIEGSKGTFSIDEDGNWSFTANSAFNELNVGDTEQASFTVTSVDGTPSTVTVTIEGTNDAATVSSASVTLQETDAPLTTGGKLTSQDIDNPDNKFTPNTIEGSKGTFSIDEDGNWSFTANSAFNELNVGDTEQASFTVTSVDGTPSTVTVTIEGTNDAATVSSASVTLQETDAPLTTGGKLTSQDIDNPDNKFTPNTIEGSKGTFSIDEDGNWSFTANSAFNELNVGDTEQASFTVTSVDGTPSTVTVTIEGTNDAATVSSASVTLQETDAPLTTGGKLTSQDIDNPDNKFTPNTIEGSKGTFSIDEDGNWSFTANSAFNELNVGDTEQASFTVTSVDGTPSTVTVTIEGTNDAATVSSASVTLQETDAPLTTGGKLTSQDIDNPDNKFTPNTIEGSKGTFSIDEDGNWSFTANSAFNELNVGDTEQASFTVTSVDGTPSTVTVTIEGTNDAATVSSASVTLQETDAPLTTGGKLTSQDIDNPDNKFTPNTIEGSKGTFSIDEDGNWSFTANSAFNELNVGDTEQASFTVTSVDGTPSTVTVTIEGTNDAATVSSASVTLQETDAPLTTGGKLTSQDIDNPDNKFTPNTIEGSKGTFSIDEDGNWSFTANSAFNELNVGDTEQASFTVTSVDGTPSTVTVTIEGTNDAATVSSASVTLQETDAPLTTGGKLTSQDIDNPDNKFTPNTIEGSKGTFSIDEDGNWSFTANSAFNELNVGDTEQASFTVTSVDGTPSTVTVTIEGTNDAATVSSASVTLQETDAPLTTGGKLTSQDIDNPDNKFTPNTIEGSKGTFSIDEDGNWSFTANSAFNELNVGDTEQASFTVTSVDGTPSTVTVTIEGTNDAATVSSASVTLQETDAPLTTGGKLTSQDIDNPDNKFTPNTIEGSKGTFSIDEDGNWSFTANSAFNELNVGDTEQASFTVTSVDGTPSTVTVTIEGTNDAATVSSASVTLQETDAPLTTGGKLTSQDIDNPDNKFTPNTIEGSKGTFSIDEDGNWTFTADSAFNELAVSDSVQASFTVTSVDGTPSTVTVTIEGTNDAATVSSASVTLQETDAPLTTGGKLTSQDIDNPDNKFTPNTIEGSKGTFSIDEDGNWSFTANSAFNELNVGDTEQASFTVTSVDGTPSTVTVTIEGTNDAATVSSASVTLQETDAPLTTGGKLTSQDIDNPDNKFTPNTIEGSKGTFSIDEDGNWTFTADSAFNELNVGDTEQASFTVTSVDGTPSTVTVTIEGTNDAATVSSASVTLQETDAPLTTGGKLTSQDIDNPDNKFTPNTIEGSKGTFSIDEDGNWSFTANSAFNELNVGDTEQASFTVTSVDGTPSTVTVTIEGTNDAATVSSASVTLQETDAPLTTGGKLTSQDIDNPDNKFTPNTIEGSKGTFSIDEDGNWTFTADSAFNELAVSDSVQASFTVTSVDGTPSTVTVTIEGTNDAATVSSASVTLQETDAPLTTGGKLTSQDIDNPDNKFTPNTIEGSKGTFSIDEDGNWSFTANSAFNELNVGDTEQASFTVTSVDGTPSTVTVTIEGTNDAATVSSASVTLQETDAPLTTGGKLTSQDIDNPDNKFTPNTIEGSKGTFSIDEDGNWSFTANSAFNELNVGDTEQASFTVTSVDGTPSTVTVTIEGTNDAATVSSASVTLQETDAPLTTGGKLTSQDIDNPDNKFTPNTIEGSKGTFSIDEDGNWSFTANSAFNELNVGDTEQASFTVTSVDGTPSTVTVTIEGTNDAATVSSASVTLQETDAPLTTGGKLTSQDIDNPDNKFTPNTIEGSKGTFSIDEDGNWSFTANSAFNELNVGDTEQASFTVTSVDGTPSTVTVTIEGTNDAATVSSASVTLQETDAPLTTGGKLTSQDIDNPDNKFTPNTIEGSKGTFSIDEDGNWSFTANSAFNELNVGDTEQASFTVTSVDGTPSTVTVTIEGTNDAATVSSASVTLQETDAPLTTGGKLTSQDIDNPDNKFTPNTIEGSKGTFSIDEDGNWSFTANSAFNELNVGDTEQASFTVTSVDGTPSTVTVTIEGTNDAATVSSASVTLQETDAPLTTGGKLTSQDIDNPDNKFTPNTIEGSKGTFSIDEDGNWSFTANSAFNELNVGDTEQASFTVTSVDGTPSTVTVTIEGTNDAATVSSASVTLQETDAPLTTGGKLTSQDIDNPDNKFTPNTIEGSKGTFSIDEDGNWSFTANSAFNELNVGDTEQASFTVTSVDGTPSTVTVTIEGTNDAATVSSASVTLQETDAPLTTGGKLTSQDIDNPDNKFTPNTIEGSKGTFSIDEDGNWSFTANSAFNELNVGDTEQASFTVTSVDGTPSTVTVTIEGTNDAATVSSASVTLQETDAPLTTGGKLTSQDIDNPDNKFTPNTIEGSKGTFSIDEDGNWSFTANSAFNELNVGDTEQASFTVTSVDGTPSTVTVTIEGTNDAATVSSASVTLQETDAPLTTGGKLTSQDIDNPDNKFTPNTIEGSKGTFSIDEDGNWSFTANSAFNELNVGDTEQASFTVTSVDGTPSTVTVTIEGTNDAATVSSASVTLQETDAPLTTGGKLTSQDIDNPDNKFTPNTIEGSKGTFSIDEDGNWSFTANSAFNELNVGDTEQASFTVTSVDGTPSTVTVTIEGTNDAATVSSASVTLQETDAPLTTGGKLTSQDIDNPDNKFTPNTIEGSKGTFSIDEDGNWTFTADSAFNELAVSDSVQETFEVFSIDGTPSAVTVTIEGTNDAPTAVNDYGKGLIFHESFEESALVNGKWDTFADYNGWTITNSDGDKAELEIQTGNVGGSSASDGNAHAELDGHELVSISRELDTKEGSTHTVTFDYKPRPSYEGDSGLTATFGDTTVVVVSDPNGNIVVTSGNGDQVEGLTVTQDPSNGWYTIGFDETVSDSTTTLSFTGTGSDNTFGAYIDNISVENTSGYQTQEDTEIRFTPEDLLANDTDPDGDELSIVDVVNRVDGNGTVELIDGEIVFTPAKDFNGVASYDYVIADTSGERSTATVFINVTPVNDPPVATDDVHTLGDNLIVNGSFEDFTSSNSAPGWGDRASSLEGWVFDANSGELDLVDDGYNRVETDLDHFIDMEGEGSRGDNVTLSQTVEGVEEGKPYQISLDIGAKGNNHTAQLQVVWNGVVIATITPDGNSMETHTFEVTGALGDNTISFVEVGGKGDNSGTYLDNIKLQEILVDLTTDEDTTLEIPHSQLLANDFDIDGDDIAITSVSITDSSHGKVEIVDGKVVFEPAENFNGVTTFEYEISDRKGGTDTAIVTINVKPINDAPEFVDDKELPLGDDETISTSTKEDAPVSGKVKATDADGDDLTYTADKPSNGKVDIDADGNWTYTPDPEFDGKDSFVITVSDGNGGTDTITVNVDVLPVAELTVTAGQPVTEGDESYLSFEINLDDLVSENVGLDLTLGATGDTATKGIDYEDKIYAKDGNDYKALTADELAALVIEQGKDSIEVFVKVIDDSLLEGEETVTLKVSSSSEYVEVPGNDSAEAKIIDETVTTQKDTVTVTLEGPSTVMEGDITTPFTITLSEAVPEKSVITLEYTYTNADNQDIVEVIEVEIAAGSKTANFTIETVQDNEYEQGQQFNVSVVSVKHDDKDVFEQLETASANRDVAIDDSKDNPPESEDFSINVGESGTARVIFNDGNGIIEGDGSDHISDNEDDNDNNAATSVGVVITELPDHGVLKYGDDVITKDDLAVFDENGNLVKEGKVFEDPNLIEYIRNENSEGFLLGVKDEQDVDSHSPTTNNFHNWGEATDDPSVRKLTLADGDVITVTASKQGNGDNNLVQYNENANHVGYGIGVGQGNGIQKGETVSINFDSRPADRITLGLDGLGSYFDKDLNNGNESKVTILVTWVDADNNVHNSPFEYQKDTSGNTDLFHEVTIPSDSFMLPDGAMIQSVDLSTEGKGNWELRYIDTRSDDSFDYRAIDSDKNYSEESTVTINNAPDANDDPQTYTVQLGTFAEDRATWNLEGVTVSGYVGKSGDFSQNANTSKELTVTDGYELGVEGSINGGPAAQLQYNRATGESEKIAISLPKPATSFSFAVSHLVSGEGAAGEQGMWTAYLDGKPVQSGVFSLESGHEGSFSYDLDVAFDTVVFEATDFVEGEAKNTDSSDYFLVGFEATGTGAYAVNQSEGEIRIPISEILSNDFDLDGDEITITGFGDTKAYISRDGEYVVFDFDNTFSGEETFEYTISDGNGGTDTANITIIVNPDVPAVSVDSIDVNANQVSEGESLSFTVNLSGSSTLSQLLSVEFGSVGTADNQDVVLSKATFTNGVTYNSYTGELFVPPNVDSFDIVIPTALDGVPEPTEAYNIAVGGVAASGDILNNDRPEVDLNGTQYQIDMVSESAGYSNVFGYYSWDSNTGTAELNVLIGNTNSVADKQALALLNSLDNVEFFLLSDGAGAIESSDVLTVDAQGKLYINGSESDQTAYFSHVDAHKSQFQISDDMSEIKIEDLPVNNGDKDYNDLVIAIRPIDDGIDYSATYVEGQDAVAIADVDADIFDDHNLVTSMSVKLTNAQSGDVVDYSRIGGQFSVDYSTPGLLVITALNGSSLIADEFEAALKAITFSNTSDDPDNTDRVIEVTVTDDKGQLSAVAETTIKVIDYNPDGTLDNQVEGAEDAVLLLSLNDFGIQSGDGLKITSSPNNVFFKNVGTSYEPDWQPISSSQVTSALIESGIIGFKALEHESGFNGFNDTLVGNTHGDYARVGFEVTIDGQTSSHTLTVEITPVADAPIVTITLDDIRQSNALFPYPTDKDSILELHASGKLLNVNGDIFQGTHDQDNGFLEASNRDSNLFIAQDKYPGAPGTPEQPLAVHYTGNYKGSDVFIGGSLDDTFKGANSDSDHTFNDHLGYDDNGEEIRAIDTVIYEGSISDFTITYEQVEGGNRFRVINTNGTETSLPSETGAGDTLYFIEQVIFSDGIVKLDNENGTATVVKSSMMPLTIDVELQDKDGSEHLVDNRVEIAGIPVGVELYVGGVKVDPVLENNGLQTFNITVDLNKDNNFSTTIDTIQLKVTPNYTGSLDFTVTACAVAQDHNGSQATGSDSEFATFATDKFIVDNSSEQQLLGDSADDVIIGDVGGIDITITPAKTYNIAILADVSGSMKEGFDGSTRLGVMKAALMSFVEGLDTHSGAINIALIGFSSSASVSISDIQDNNWSALEAAINLLSADGATNYEAAFDSAKNWFDSLGDSSTDADNLTLFVTDGKPTTYTGDSSISGGRTDDEDLSKAITAYNELTAISKVKAIGIATDSSETHILRMFDNTNIVDSDYADIRQVSSIVEQTIDIVVSGKDDPKTVTGNEFNIGINQSASLVLDFSITEQLGKNDTFQWNIEKLAGDQWETSVGPVSSTSDMSIEIIDAGTYRLALDLENGSRGHGELDGVKLDATISIFESTQVPLGQVEVVTSGDQLVAVLEGEISYITYREMDSDHILGGRGDDIISGDAINTDYLPWEDVGSPAEKSLGLDGLKQFLTLRNGFEPSDEELHQFVVENHDTFKLFEETLDDTNSVLGQSDTLDGGMGSDILYGQGGDDTLIGRLGDDILTGGEGADIFKWVDGDLDGSVDVIKDFSKDEGDKIDLSELFEGDDRSVDDIISQYVKVEDTDADDNHAEIVVTKGDDRVTIELEGWNSADLTDQLKDILIIKD